MITRLLGSSTAKALDIRYEYETVSARNESIVVAKSLDDITKLSAITNGRYSCRDTSGKRLALSSYDKQLTFTKGIETNQEDFFI